MSNRDEDDSDSGDVEDDEEWGDDEQRSIGHDQISQDYQESSYVENEEDYGDSELDGRNEDSLYDSQFDEQQSLFDEGYD